MAERARIRHATRNAQGIRGHLPMAGDPIATQMAGVGSAPPGIGAGYDGPERMMKSSWLLLIAALVPSLSCFNDCDRSGCESFNKVASTHIGQGIGGAISLESDQVTDGCQVCALSEAGLEVWRVPAAVHDATAACQLAATPFTMAFTALGHYDQELDPGDYLVCVSGKASRPCIGVTVAAGKVSTLNVKHTYGHSAMAVLDPSGAAFRSDAFDCVSGS
jgi:hypothetical protein